MGECPQVTNTSVSHIFKFPCNIGNNTTLQDKIATTCALVLGVMLKICSRISQNIFLWIDYNLPKPVKPKLAMPWSPFHLKLNIE